jgi:tRNA G10  N-methylase Trm11
MHKKLKGSNPTWTKRVDAKIDSGVDFEEALAGIFNHVSGYGAQIRPMDAEFSVDLANRDVANLDWEAGSLDAIVTSPPYPNRTDYIRHYLPAAELLLGGDHDTERTLREVQIGTPLIREGHANTSLPASVETVIERVRNHRSYASERYYAKGFRYYFDDMARSLAQFTRWLAPNGTVILVVQDTYYKEILISVADLLGDIATASGLAVIGQERFKVRHALSRLSPHSRAVPKPQLFETVVMLTKA